MRRRRKRRKHKSKKKQSQPTYPDPETRREIIAQRDQILKEAILSFIEDDTTIINDLVRRYGVYHVRYVLERYRAHTHTSFLIDEAAIYRRYRWLFAQFGDDRPFLSKQAYDDAIDSEIQDAEQVYRMVFGPSTPDNIRETDRLTHLVYATDITPPDVPPKPDDFVAPTPHSYSRRLKPLLNLGWQLDESAIAPQLRRKRKWRKALPELIKMATDPGLIHGWPGEKASWAPYHALTLLGHVGNPEVAASLLALLGVENDWLSDRLPDVWAQIGPDAAAPLWRNLREMAYEEDELGVLVAGLIQIAQSHPDKTKTTVRSFIELLEAGAAEYADLNAYIVYALDQLGDDTAVPAIKAALDEGRVNPRIMNSDSVTLLGATFG